MNKRQAGKVWLSLLLKSPPADLTKMILSRMEGAPEGIGNNPTR